MVKAAGTPTRARIIGLDWCSEHLFQLQGRVGVGNTGVWGRIIPPAREQEYFPNSSYNDTRGKHH